MIILFPEGGLGNQLFQYSAAITLSELRGNDEVVIDTEFYTISQYRKFELNKFKLSKVRFATENDRKKIEYKCARKLILSYRKYFSENLEKFFKTSEGIREIILNKMGIYVHARHIGDKEIPISLIKRKNIYLWGYFLRPRFVKLLKNIELKSENSSLELWKNNCMFGEDVCVHIRLGDYIGNTLLDVCTKEYYYRAIKKIMKDIENPVFHLFSDDLELVKKEFCFPAPVIYEEEKNASICLIKMSLCNHFILSNSTYSWWACHLSQNKKLVIAPMYWFKQKDTPFYLYDNTWSKIKS